MFHSDSSYSSDSTADPGLRLDQFELRQVLVLAPHPDDETLGCGGLIASCSDAGVSVEVLALSNGEASHPGTSEWAERLARLRCKEQEAALISLGCLTPQIRRFNLPDGRMEALADRVLWQTVEEIVQIIHRRNIDSLFTSCIDDQHGDHRFAAVVAGLAVLVCPDVRLFAYQIWPPEQRRTLLTELEQSIRLDITGQLPRKREAIALFQTQLNQTVDPSIAGFELPDDLLSRKTQSFEEYLFIGSARDWIEQGGFATSAEAFFNSRQENQQS